MSNIRIHIYLAKTTARRIITKFLRTGSVLNTKKKRKTYDDNDATTVRALNSVEVNPRHSLRKRQRKTNISKSELQRIFKAKKIKAFKPKIRHTLEEGDEAYRLDFCLLLGEKILQNHQFHRDIIFFDETTGGQWGCFHSKL